MNTNLTADITREIENYLEKEYPNYDYTRNNIEKNVQLSLEKKEFLINHFLNGELKIEQKVQVRLSPKTITQKILSGCRDTILQQHTILRHLESIQNNEKFIMSDEDISHWVASSKGYENLKKLIPIYFNMTKTPKLNKALKQTFDYFGVHMESLYSNPTSHGDDFIDVLSQIQQQLKLDKQTYKVVLSADPYDFVRGSQGNSWSSCFHPEGCNSLSPWILMQDSTSLVAYVEASDGNLLFRAWVDFGFTQEETLVTSRVHSEYPSTGVVTAWFKEWMEELGLRESEHCVPVDEQPMLYSDNTMDFIDSTLKEDDYVPIIVKGDDIFCLICGDPTEGAREDYNDNNIPLCECCMEEYKED